MKHTPGPYIALDNFIYSMHIDQHMKQVADCDTAEFVSSAPDLLSALEILTDHASEQYPHFESERGQADIDVARAAITKAKGGE